MAPDPERPPGEPLARPLSRDAAVAMLREAVAVGVRPRTAWLAGLLVPVFGYVPSLSRSGLTVSDGQGVPSPIAGLEFNLGHGALEISLVAAALALIWMRLQAQAVAGLVLEADRRTGWLEATPADPRAERPKDGDEPTLGTIWQRGATSAGDCFAILAARYGLGVLTLIVALVVPAMIAMSLDRWPAGLQLAGWSLFILITLVVFLYLALIEIVAQVALISAVHNRRGPVSALQHAWRLMRADPGASTRAGLAHFGLLVGVVVLQAIAGAVLGSLGYLLGFAIAGAGGVARIAFWERAYEALGGWRTATPKRESDADPKASAGGAVRAA